MGLGGSRSSQLQGCGDSVWTWGRPCQPCWDNPHHILNFIVVVRALMFSLLCFATLQKSGQTTGRIQPTTWANEVLLKHSNVPLLLCHPQGHSSVVDMWRSGRESLAPKI